MEPEIQKVIKGKCRAAVPFPESVVLGAAGGMPRNYSQRTTCPAIQSEVDSEADEVENTLVVMECNAENAIPEVSESEAESSLSSEVSNLANQGSPTSPRSPSRDPSNFTSRSSESSSLSPIPAARNLADFQWRSSEPSSSSPSPIPAACNLIDSRSPSSESSSLSPIPATRKPIDSRSRPREPSSSRSPSPIPAMRTNSRSRSAPPGASSESNETSPSAATTSNQAVHSIQKSKRPNMNGRRRPAKRVKISNTQQSFSAPLEEENDDSEGLPFFTIHQLLSAAELEHRLNSDDADRCGGEDIELELIQNIMEEINGDYRFENQKYKHWDDAEGFPDNSDSNFTSAFYSRIINATASYGQIAHGVREETGTSDTLDFVYRPGVIFCITTGQGWVDVRKFVDFNFPQKIMCRLTDEASNVETKRFFVGELAKSVVYNRRPSESDQLTSFSENQTKPARNNSSLYHLSAFQTKNGKKVAGQIRIEFGLTGVRFERKIFTKCIPELLDHLCTIVQGRETHVFESLGEKEKDIKMRLARYISQRDPIVKELNRKLTCTIYNFVTNSCTEELLNRFEVCPSQLAKFYNACNFVLLGYGFDTQKLSGCPPTSQEVFEAMRRIKPLHTAKNLDSFLRKIKKLTLSFSLNGKGRQSISFLNLLPGEISLEGRTYWKFANMWLYFTGDYHHLLDKKLLEILNMKTQDARQDDILFESAQEAKLIIPWNAGEKKSDYLEKYRNVQDWTDTICYCLSPRDTEQDGKYLFDMMIVEVKQGHPFLSILYIFDRFNSGLPPASNIINESLNKITKSTDTDHHLEAFYEYQIRMGHGRHRNLFPRLFPKFEDFQRCFHSGVERKVSVVVGFLTVLPGDDEDGAIGYTLRREKTLPRQFSREDGQRILWLLETYPEELERIQRKLERARENDPEGIPDNMPGFILTLLRECGYSLNEDGDLSGSLLKIQFGSDFKLFRNDELNEKVFDECIREKFITGFPGFKHKLEVYFIRNKVAHENQFQLRLVDL